MNFVTVFVGFFTLNGFTICFTAEFSFMLS